MNQKTNTKESLKSKIQFLTALIFVYVILFEFILEHNKILPKPSLLLESFISIWKDYDLVETIAITTTTIYLAIAISSFFIYRFSGYILKIFFEYEEVIEKLKIFRYFPALFFAILFSFWFSNSIMAGFLFALLSSGLIMIVRLLSYSKINRTYFDVALNLGLNKNEIYRKVVFKDILPRFVTEFSSIHYYLWILVMIYEFVNEIKGFGGIYRTALAYNDFTGLFPIAIIISILIWFGSIIINYMNNKIVFWES